VRGSEDLGWVERAVGGDGDAEAGGGEGVDEGSTGGLSACGSEQDSERKNQNEVGYTRNTYRSDHERT
jgi:hypothetical protein